MKLLLLLLCAALPSCAYIPRPASIPVKTLSSGDPASKDLIVFLPGRWSLPKEFEREGLQNIAKAKWPEARFVIPDLHLGYYEENSMATRLHQDVILPARKVGVETVRFVGVSMGGLGSLIYDIEHPGEVDEIYLLAPFLGEEDVIAEITAAGSLEKWKPTELGEKDFSRKLWLKLREKRKGKDKLPTIHLGTGTEDRLARSSRLFASEFLSEKDQTWILGAHDWETWRELFEQMTAKY